MEEIRITESELILPSLYIMSLHNGKIDTSQLIKQLNDLIKPSGTDAEILKGRKDFFFTKSQKFKKS